MAIGSTSEFEVDDLYEVVDGVRVETAPMGAFQVYLATILFEALSPVARSNSRGRCYVEMLFLLNRETALKRRPDLAFVSYERWPRGHRPPRAEAWDVVPDLAVEVVSPSNSADEIQHKIGEYFAAGVRAVWVVYPLDAIVQVYASLKSVRILDRHDRLDGGELLPEFSMPLSDLFEDEAD